MNSFLFKKIGILLYVSLMCFSVCANHSFAIEDDEIDIIQPYFDYPGAPLVELQIQESSFQDTAHSKWASIPVGTQEFNILLGPQDEEIVIKEEIVTEDFSVPRPYLAFIEKDESNYETKVHLYHPDEKTLIQIEHFNDSQPHRTLKPCVNGAGYIVIPFSRSPSSNNLHDIFDKLALAFINPFMEVEKSSFILLEDEYARMEPLFNGVLLEEEGVLFDKRNLYLAGPDFKVPRLIARVSKNGFYRTDPLYGQVLVADRVGGKISLMVYETYRNKIHSLTCGQNIIDFMPKVLTFGPNEVIFLLRDSSDRLNLFLWNLYGNQKNLMPVTSLVEVYEGFKSSNLIFIHAKDSEGFTGLFEVDFESHSLLKAKASHPSQYVFPDGYGFYSIDTQQDASVLIKRINTTGEDCEIKINNVAGLMLKHAGHHFFFKIKETESWQHLDFKQITLQHLNLKGSFDVLEFSPVCEFQTFFRLIDIAPHDFDLLENSNLLAHKGEKRVHTLAVLGSLFHKDDASKQTLNEYITSEDSMHFALTLKGILSWIYPEVDELD